MIQTTTTTTASWMSWSCGGLDRHRGPLSLLPPAQQRGLHLHGRDRGGGAPPAPSRPLGGLVRLQRRRLARPLPRQRVEADDRNPCELFRNNGDGTFTECAAEHGLTWSGSSRGWPAPTSTTTAGRTSSCRGSTGRRSCCATTGPPAPTRRPSAQWRFTNVAEVAGVTEPPISFPCWFWDYNNDGWPDIFVSGYRIQDVGDIAAEYLGLPQAGQRPKLYRNNGDGTFADVTKECGLDHVLADDGRQLRRPRQRRLARLLPGNRQPGPEHPASPTGCSATTAGCGSRT
jgi:hypothetical protein